MSVIQLMIVEPVLAKYRVPLFERLAAIPDFKLHVAASRTFPGAPASVNPAPLWAHLDHTCVQLGGRLFQWQRDLQLPPGFGPGDVLVVDANPRVLSNWRLMRDARRRGASVIQWGHAWSPTSKHWRAAIRYRLMNRADLLLVYTEAEVELLKKWMRWRPAIASANNAIDQGPVLRACGEWTADRLQMFRRENGIDGRNVLLFCGRLRAQPATGLRVAMDALTRLSADTVLVIVGGGEDEPALRDYANSVGVAARVLWVGALYDENKLAPWFLSAMCFVYPGSMGLSVLHAFGYGLPVVTHDRKSLHGPEIHALRNHTNGLTFPMGDSANLAQCIASLAESEELRTKLSAGARKTAYSEFTMDNMAAHFESAVRLASRARFR